MLPGFRQSTDYLKGSQASPLRRPGRSNMQTKNKFGALME